MSVTYTTVPLIVDKDSSEKIKWFEPGIVATSAQTPTMGDKSAFKSDVTWNFTGNLDIQEKPGFKISATNGKSHYATYECGISGGLFCPAHRLNGFSVEAAPNSNAGHALFFRRMGLKFENFSGKTQFWGGSPFDKKSGYDWMQYTKGFNIGEIESLEGYVVTRFVFEISTASGSLTTTSEIRVGGFKLHYSCHGPSNARWVIGTRRSSPFGTGFVNPKGFYY